VKSLISGGGRIHSSGWIIVRYTADHPGREPPAQIHPDGTGVSIGSQPISRSPGNGGIGGTHGTVIGVYLSVGGVYLERGHASALCAPGGHQGWRPPLPGAPCISRRASTSSMRGLGACGGKRSGPVYLPGRVYYTGPELHGVHPTEHPCRTHGPHPRPPPHARPSRVRWVYRCSDPHPYMRDHLMSWTR
jgi:hypothetical protein